MTEITNEKNNVPYYILGLATLSGIASVILAVSPTLAAFPSLAFLAPIAGFAVSLGTPLIGVFGIVSFGAAILSGAVIIRNHTRSKQEAKLVKKDSQSTKNAREIDGQPAIDEQPAKVIAKQEGESKKIREERIADRQANEDHYMHGDMHLDEFFDNALVKPAIETDIKSPETIPKSFDNALVKPAIETDIKPQETIPKSFDNALVKPAIETDIKPQETTPKSLNGSSERAKGKKHNEEGRELVKKRTKAASKQKESGWFSPKAKAFGALAGIAYFGGGFGGVLSYFSSHSTSLANNVAGVGNIHSGYAPSSLPVLPDSQKDVVQSGLEWVQNKFKACEEKEKVDFGITNPSEEIGSTSISLSMKDRFFNLFSWKSTPVSYVNGTTDVDAVESIRVLNETSEEPTPTEASEAENILNKDVTDSALVQHGNTTYSSDNGFLSPLSQGIASFWDSIKNKASSVMSFILRNPREESDNPCYNTDGNVPSGFVCNKETTYYVTPPIQANGTAVESTSQSASETPEEATALAQYGNANTCIYPGDDQDSHHTTVLAQIGNTCSANQSVPKIPLWYTGDTYNPPLTKTPLGFFYTGDTYKDCVTNERPVVDLTSVSACIRSSTPSMVSDNGTAVESISHSEPVSETQKESATTQTNLTEEAHSPIPTNGYGIGTALKSVVVGAVGVLGGVGVIETVRVLGDLADVAVLAGRAGAYRW